MSKSEYKVVKRSELYYGRFAYKISFNMRMAGRTAYCYSSDQLKEHLKSVRLWQRSAREMAAIDREIADIDWGLMDAFFKFKRTYSPKNSKKKDNRALIVVNYSGGHFYVTDLKILRKVEDLGIAITEITECEASLPREVKFFKNQPKHKYRIYFRSRKIDPNFRQNMLDCLNTYSGLIIPSNTFLEWLKATNLPRWFNADYLQANHFIEYDDDSYQTILLLMFEQKYFGKCFECRQETVSTVQS